LKSFLPPFPQGSSRIDVFLFPSLFGSFFFSRTIIKHSFPSKPPFFLSPSWCRSFSPLPLTFPITKVTVEVVSPICLDEVREYPMGSSLHVDCPSSLLLAFASPPSVKSDQRPPFFSSSSSLLERASTPPFPSGSVQDRPRRPPPPTDLGGLVFPKPGDGYPLESTILRLFVPQIFLGRPFRGPLFRA